MLLLYRVILVAGPEDEVERVVRWDLQGVSGGWEGGVRQEIGYILFAQ